MVMPSQKIVVELGFQSQEIGTRAVYRNGTDTGTLITVRYEQLKSVPLFLNRNFNFSTQIRLKFDSNLAKTDTYKSNIHPF